MNPKQSSSDTAFTEDPFKSAGYIVEVPDRLREQLPERCYTPLGQKGKSPILNKWPERPLTAEELMPYLQRGNNYGVICGTAGINIVDLEHIAPLEELKARLPPTLTIISGGGGLHLYYKGTIERGLEILGTNGEHWGEIRAGAQQAVGPGSVHPSGRIYRIIEDRPIIEITESQLKEALGESLREKPTLDAQQVKQLVKEGSTISAKIPIMKVCEAYGFLPTLRAGNDGEYYGPHPVHGSDNGHNFWVNENEGVWCCHRTGHDSGGDSLMLIAMMEGIIDCTEAHKGTKALSGEKFFKAIEAAKAKGLLSQEDYNSWVVERAQDPTAAATEEVAEERYTPVLTGDFIYTDAGNAERFAGMWGCTVKHTPEKGWLVWDGKRWINDERLLYEKARETVLNIIEDAKNAKDDREIKAILGYVKSSLSRGKLSAMTELANGCGPCISHLNDFDQDPWLVNCDNGIVDLKTGGLLPHNPDRMLTKMAAVIHNQSAECPKWLAFVNTIFQGNQELIRYVQKLAGYTLTGLVTDRLLIILHGPGRNGKTTFMNVISQILGDYAGSINLKALSIQKYSGIPNDIAKIAFCRLVTASEGAEGQKLNVSLIKELTGRQKGRARFLFGEWFDFDPIQKYWIDTNYKPVIKETDIGTWDRIKLIPFSYTFPEEKIVENYDKVLLEEKEGIFNWLLEGCLLWQKEGLKAPDIVKAATREYRLEMDVIGQFIEECCTTGENEEVGGLDLYNEYASWFKSNFGGGEEGSESKEKPIGIKTFYKRWKTWAIRRKEKRAGVT